MLGLADVHGWTLRARAAARACSPRTHIWWGVRAARSPWISLLLSCHPVPTAAVTAIATVQALAAGGAPGVVALVLLAVLSGQLSIGWSNDLLDAERDRSAGRTDKPVAAGALPRRTLGIALAVATAAVVPLSFALGWQAAAAHLVGVAFGWAYNLGLKATPFSPVPYAVAFGALPAVATLSGSAPAAPPWWAVTAGALLGVGAHFGNVLPDIRADREAGVLGLPQRAGSALSSSVAAAAVVSAAALVFTPAVLVSPAAVPLAALVVALAGATIAIARTGRRLRLAFVAVMLAAGLCVAMLVLSGGLAR